jgi:GMP synthase (glutamine-hydrolysing)
MRVLVIETQRTVPLGSLGPPLARTGIDIVHWRTEDEAPPGSLAEFSGVVALGGAANPDQDDRYPWLADERDLLAEALARRLPTIGLCLGAELIAEALGADTRRLTRPEIGWVELENRGAAGDALAVELPSRFPAFQWHSYGFDLPPSATLIAGSEQAAQAFGWGRHTWGFQFHLEADEAIIVGWIDDYADLLREEGLDADALRRETKRRAADYVRSSQAVGRAFAATVRRSAWTVAERAS